MLTRACAILATRTSRGTSAEQESCSERASCGTPIRRRRCMWKLPGVAFVCALLLSTMDLQDAHAADRVELLLRLLQKKGIITAEEAEALNQEVTEAAQTEGPAALPVQSEPREPSTAQEREPKKLAEHSEGEVRTELGNEGLWVRTLDGRFGVRIGGFLIADWRYFGIDTPQHDFFDIRRARLAVEGWVHRDFRFKVQGEFEGSREPKLRDGYVEWTHFPWAQFRAGQYKQPFSIEYLTPLKYNPFTERSFVSALVPGRDVGAMLNGTFRDEAIVYGLSLANGSGLDPGLDSSSDKDVVGRAVFRPLLWSKPRFLQALRLGGSFSYGRIDPLDLRDFEITTAGTTPIFRLASGGKFGLITEADKRRRIGAEASWPLGPLLLQAEYAKIGFGGLRGTVGDPFDAEIQAWYASALVFLTGEHPRIEGGVLQGVRPRADFDLSRGTWGAFSVGVRYDAFSADRDLFRVVDPVAFTAGAHGLAGALNWYLNPSVRVAFDFVHTGFDDPVAVGYTFTAQTFEDSEDVLISRFQLDF
jgi:phosphate-selective porin OprO/OprP